MKENNLTFGYRHRVSSKLAWMKPAMHVLNRKYSLNPNGLELVAANEPLELLNNYLVLRTNCERKEGRDSQLVR